MSFKTFVQSNTFQPAEFNEWKLSAAYTKQLQKLVF